MNSLEKTLRYIVLGGIFLLPFVCLLVTTSLFFPYITGKNFAFRIIVEIITGAWLALALVSSQYRPQRSWILGAFAIFVLIMAIADAQGVNPFKSFWSNFERMDGWVTIGHLLMYTVVAASVMRTELLWRRLFQLSLVISVFLTVDGLFQILGKVALGEGGVSGLSARIDATFGNPIYLAIYMLFNIFVAALLWAQQRQAPQGKNTALSYWYGAVIVLDTAALFFTGTRGTMLGLIGGGVLALLIYAVVQGTKQVRTYTVVTLIVLAVLGGGLKLAKDTAAVKSIGFLDRLASISLSDNTINARFLNMGIALQGVKERPVFGWGQENYAIVFDKYYDPRMYAQEPWFDRVHNIIFDWWIAGGTLGLLAYLSIFFVTVWAIWRRDTKGARAFSVAEGSILTGLLAGYFIHNLTVFDNVTSYIWFGTILAYIAWRSASHEAAPAVPSNDILNSEMLPYAALGAAILTAGALWMVNGNAIAQNMTLLKAIAPQSNPSVNLTYFKQASAYGSFGTQEVREQLAQGASQIAAATTIATDTKQQFYQLALTEMQQQAVDSPLDARFPLFLGIIYSSFGDAANAAAALEKAHELSPRKQTIYFQIGQTALARGDNAGALTAFKTAFELDTSDSQARLLYATVAIQLAEDSLADQLLAPAIANDTAADQRILGAYVSRKLYAKAITIWQAHISATPSDMQAYFTLAALEYQVGNKQLAIAALEAAKKQDPTVAAQADPLIQQIQAGTVKLQ
ncbi:MAG: hypothetical protein JWM46_281 [Candidatus Kaiserbacteria bacterium]|nr:hypothetical protein [Candidatus Kaiserbacteria bacterium]